MAGGRRRVITQTLLEIQPGVTRKCGIWDVCTYVERRMCVAVNFSSLRPSVRRSLCFALPVRYGVELRPLAYTEEEEEERGKASPSIV